MTVLSTEYNVYRGLNCPINPKEQEPESIQPNVVFRASRLGQVHANATAFLYKTGDLRSSAPVAFSSKRPDKASILGGQHNNGVASLSADLDVRYAQLGTEIDSLALQPVSIPERQAISSSTVTVSAELSRVDAVKGLWRCSSSAHFFATVPNGDALRQEQESAAWQNPAAVEAAIQRNSYVDYIGGRCVKTDLSQFPIIDLTSYKEQCEIDMSVEEIVKKCLTNNPSQRLEEEQEADRIKNLTYCLKDHPIFGGTAGYLEEKKVFSAVAKVFANDTFASKSTDEEMQDRLRSAIALGSSMDPTLLTLEMTVISLKKALEDCTRQD